MQHAGKSIKKKTWPDRIAIFAPALILAALFVNIVHGYELDERLVAMRYLLFGLSGLLAFVLPYLSFPDSDSKIYQVANCPPFYLMKSYMNGHQAVWGTGFALVLVTALADSRGVTPEFTGQVWLALYGSLFLMGIYLYSACRYLKIGKESQDWQEGNRGQEVRQQMAAIAKYPIDPGSIPSLISSVLIAFLGMMSVVAGALAFGLAGSPAEVSVAVVLLVFSAGRYASIRSGIDRYYYHTNAFFSEFFGVASSPGLDREPLKTEQLWWIPARWKTHGWALMLQMDRKLPAGRFIAVGHLFIWVLAYQDAGESVMFYAWTVFAVMHHGLLLLTANSAIVPKWWLRKLDKPIHWILSRFWIQVRWILPLIVSMSVMKGFFALFEWGEIGLILLVYLLAGAMTASIISRRYEQHWVN